MKNKVIISFMFLICIFFIPSFCHAFSFEHNGIDYDMSEYKFYDYTFAFQNGPSFIDVWSFSDVSSVKFKLDSDNRLSFFKNKGEGEFFRYWYRISILTGEVDVFYDNSFIGVNGSMSSGSGSAIGFSAIVASTFDIKDEEGSIVFGDSFRLKLNLTVSPLAVTSNVPVLISSDWYVLEKWNTSLEVFTENQMYDVYMHIPQVEKPVRY